MITVRYQCTTTTFTCICLHFRGAQFEVDGEDESENFRDPDDHDTVGAVACDADGNMAYATSTGGITAKMCGRVGDSPIPGTWRAKSIQIKV